MWINSSIACLQPIPVGPEQGLGTVYILKIGLKRCIGIVLAFGTGGNFPQKRNYFPTVFTMWDYTYHEGCNTYAGTLACRA